MIKASSKDEKLTDIKSFEKRLNSEELDFMVQGFWSNDKDNPGEATKFGSMKGFKVLSEAMLKNVVDSSENQADKMSATEIF